MPPFRSISSHLHLFEDACNGYVITDGDRAMVIDCGSGAVADALPELGVRTVDWVLFTHHHRDQCFGARRLIELGAKLAVPYYERRLFDRAGEYWQQKRIFDNYNDRSTFFSLGEDLPVAASLVDYERFEWGPYSLYVLPTPGHTLGSVSLIADIDGARVAFTGDLMHAGGKLYQLHAMEYDYGDLAGANWTAGSIHALGKQEPELALPSHGPLIDTPSACIEQLHTRLRRLMDFQRDRLCGTPEGKFAHEVRMEEISPHLLWGTEMTCSNFYVIKADNGKTMLIDYPYSSTPLFLAALHTPEPFGRLRFIEHHLDELRDAWGVTSFDVVVPTHIHDDHTCGIPHLQRHYGTRCWALDRVAEVIEAPHQWNTPCLLEQPIPLDRRFHDGETFEWEGFKFEIVFYPGQTEFHSAILAEIDGRRVIFSGDSTYPLKRYQPEKQREWMVNTVIRNSLTFEMHQKCAEEFERLQPELLCPGHGPYHEVPPEAFAEHRRYVEEKESVWRDLLPTPAAIGLDLFWCRLMPYQSEVEPGQNRQITLLLRNSFERTVHLEASLDSALPISVQPARGSIALDPNEEGEIGFLITTDKEFSSDSQRRYLLQAHISVDGKPCGPIAEALLSVAPPPS